MHYQWHITDTCDQRCKHCYIYNSNEPRVEMSLDNMKFALNKMMAFEKIDSVSITGGDPILHPNFWELLKLLHDNKVKFSILGNPFHLTSEVIKRLKHYGCVSYQVSIDGSKRTHDGLRKVGSYDSTIEAIKLLKENGLESHVMMTVSSLNINEVLDVIDVVAQLKVDVFAFARYCSNGNDTIGITPQQYRDLFYKVNDRVMYWKEHGWKGFRRKDHLWILWQADRVDAEKLDIDGNDWFCGCQCGRGHLTIVPNGDIMACRRVPDSVVGNIFKDDLKDIWYKRMEEYRDLSRFEKCKNCFLLKVCRGCPAVAKCETGSFYGKDPQCWKEV